MRISSVKLVSFVVLTLTLAAGACDSKKHQTSASAASSAAAASAAAAPSASASAPKLPPYVGHFEGKYDAKLFRIEMTAAQGAVKQWEEDDGAALSGSGSVVLDIGEDKRIQGTSTGPLGALRASGLFEDGRVRVAFLPDAAAAPEQAVGATLVGTLEGDKLKGTLQASSGDSLKARTATVELERKAGAPRPASGGDSPGGK